MSEREQMLKLQAALNDDDRYISLLTLILERQDVILEKVDALDTKVDGLDGELTGHMHREEKVIGQWMDSLPKKPDGAPDVEGHRDFHQELIEEARARKTMWRELRTEIIKKGTWGIVLVLSALVAYWWNHEVRK